MTLNLKTRYIRYLYPTCRSYCNNKSIYERDEAGPQPRKVHGNLYPEWRRPWIQRDGEWSSKLSVFVEKSPSMHVLNAMQKIPDLTVQDVKEWWGQMKLIQEIENQRYLPERVAALGVNLGAVHFFTYRQCAVRVKGQTEWIEGDITSLNLPDSFRDGYYVESIDCTKFHHNGIRYEGLQNLLGLSFLKWLSLKNNRNVDVWCLDRIAGQNGNSLEFLNIEGCNLCPGGVHAIARMEALKILEVSDPGDNIQLQAALSILEQERPHLLINASTATEDRLVLKDLYKDCT
ncbi:distal membrane-arm assembly complex protein 2 isoform X1 [Pararge aegeria]|uniref:distal membrane-arm assembly complex protein 2 isoform X1 n=1 Tax=Pararge aegeria TaxID=116150 RepID=UPI0019D2D026|nr:distal membrane-arm assembly complex protein 2 isoform X1 [Pararge aegeria]